jgi:hypothetical protein
MIKRPGAKLIAKIPEGCERKLLCNGDVLLVHPDHPPRIIRVSDGKISELLKPQ